MTNICEIGASLPIVAFVGSPLQYASFVASGHVERRSFIVGHRTMPGDISLNNAVLNDVRFIANLDELIGDEEIEIYLPNSINALFLACAADPRIKKISYLDEGHLTTRYLESHHSKKLNPFTPIMVKAFSIAMLAPSNVRPYLLKVLSIIHMKAFIKNWIKDSENYKYQVIDRRFKDGVILSHLKIETPVPNVEFVDILNNVEKTNLYDGYVCVMLHPNVVSSHKDVIELVEKLLSLKCRSRPLLLKPHPLFSMYHERLQNFCAQLTKYDFRWKFAEVSNKQETSVELYALGVRTFILTSETTIEKTVTNHLGFFRDLVIVKV